MKQLFIAFLTVCTLSLAVLAQTKAGTDNKPTAAQQQNQVIPFPADLAAFLNGEWEGAGKFSSGKEIKADVRFSPVLDGQWLLYSHQDREPNRYKALGMWGFERGSGKFLMVLQDNFGGTRRFESAGWKEDSVTFVNDVNTPAISYAERFTFTRLSDRSFKMTYETNRDGKDWKLGDYVVFTRKS